MTEGERWAAALLEELRASRFTPRAWARFLARSFERAGVRREERRRAHRQALALGGVGLALCCAVVLTGRPVLGGVCAVWWVVVLLMLDWHLGMLERPPGRRRLDGAGPESAGAGSAGAGAEIGRALDGLGFANLLSLLRVAFVPVLVALPAVPLGIALLVLGAADVLDGRIARRRQEATRLGLWLDGVADGLVLGVAGLALVRAGLLPGWAAGLVVARYGALWLALALAYFVRAAPPPQAGHVPARLPGVVLLAGLVLAAFGVVGGAALAAVGAVGGLAALAATLVRSQVLLRTSQE